MKLIQNNDINLKTYFKNLKMDYIFDSIYEGNTPAKVYINQIEHPTLVIVHEGHGFFFGGETQDECEYDQAITYLITILLTTQLKKDLGSIKIYYSNDIWKHKLLIALEKEKYKVYNGERLLFQRRLNASKTFDSIEGIQLLPIDSALIEKNLKNTNFLLNEINYMWGSKDTFLEKGFGTCAIKEDTLLGWCTVEYRSAFACGIGIETIESVQNKNIGSLM